MLRVSSSTSTDGAKSVILYKNVGDIKMATGLRLEQRASSKLAEKNQ
jgi:hypothetical protein